MNYNIHNQDNIEVIEIKFDRDGSFRTDDVYSDSVYSEEEYDIANIQMQDDMLELLIIDNDKCELNSDSIKEEKLDTEEMAISKDDKNTLNDNFAMKMETVEQPSRKIEKLNRLKKSTVCRVCGKLYVTRTSYLRHLLKQHSNHTLTKQNSNVCLIQNNLVKKSKVGINELVKEEEASNGERGEGEEEENEPRIMCDACGKTFRFKSSYRKHVRDQHSDEQPKEKPVRSRRMCDLCGKICSSGSFKGHMKKHTNPESVTCEHCGQVFSFVSVLKSHIKVRHSNERPFHCKLCESTFKRADYLRSHMRYKHEPKLLRCEDKSHPYRCEDCDSTFRNKESLEKHRTWKSENDKDRRCPATFQCEICESTFKKRNYLVLHKRYVHDERRPFRISEASVGPYKCDKCERRFASVCGRNYHCKSAHGTIFDTKFSETCDHCGLTFRNRVFYAKHCAKLREKPTCYLCWNAFDDEETLKEHMHEVHVDDLPFLCELCHNRFVTLRQLNDHIRSRHAKIRPFKCDYCHHTSVRKDSLEVHIRSCHLGQKPYKCDLCDKAFSQSSDLLGIFSANEYVFAVIARTLKIKNKKNKNKKKISEDFEIAKDIPHWQNETELPIKDFNEKIAYNEKRKKLSKLRNRLRICHLCGKHYTTDSGFRHHMVMHRDPSFSCHLCGHVFYESQNLKKHLAAIHSEERPFQCHMCGTKYKRKDVLQEHIKRVHDGVKRVWNPQLLKKYRSNAKMTIKDRYQCPHCNKCMASKGYLNDHINGAHIKKELYKCNECPMTFTRKASFKYHFKRAHILKKRVLEPRGTFLKDCEYCGLQFQIKKYYEIHVASKHFNKYPCEHCEEIFDNKFYLAKHTETKHADLISKCKLCGKSFSEDTHLKRHIYLCHTERNPYECHNCGYKANKKSTLEVHMRRHTGEKPYQCDVCTKRFAQSVDYRKHRANHFKHKVEERNNSEVKESEYIIDSNEIIVKIEDTNEKKEY
ncbi:hypothetical protein PGB90_004458 [Kerria lacca]